MELRGLRGAKQEEFLKMRYLRWRLEAILIPMFTSLPGALTLTSQTLTTDLEIRLMLNFFFEVEASEHAPFPLHQKHQSPKGLALREVHEESTRQIVEATEQHKID